jgi:hypothetical protein
VTAAGGASAVPAGGGSSLLLLALVSFGEQENSRFLFIGLELAEPERSQVLAVEIDGRRLSKGDVACHGRDTFCSAAIAVDGTLLKRLLSARMLTVVEPSNKRVLLTIPLDGFAQRARAL